MKPLLLIFTGSLPSISAIVIGWVFTAFLLIVIVVLIFKTKHRIKTITSNSNAVDVQLFFTKLLSEPTSDAEILAFAEKGVSSYSWKSFKVINDSKYQGLSTNISEKLMLLKQKKGICPWDNVTESAFKLTPEEAKSQITALLREFKK